MQNKQNLQLQLQSLNLLQQQLEVLNNQLEIINSSIQLVGTAKKTIEGLAELKPGDEIINPIGGMAYIKANVVEPNKILIYVGADVIIEKDISSAIEYIDKLIERHTKQRDLIINQYMKLDAQIKELTPKVQQQLGEYTQQLQKQD
jgi:prefoldin alpha subunit